MALSGEAVAQILYQAGFRGEDLVNMVAIAKRESGWNPSAHRTDNDPSAMTGDMGLLQINSVNWGTVSKALGLTSKSQLFDPLVNARAAKVLFDRSGLAPWTMGSNGWAQGGDPFKGTNRQEAATVVQNATGQGLTGTPYQGGDPFSAAPISGASSTNTGPVSIPSDARIIRNQFGMFAIFEPHPGVFIQYGIPWHDGSVRWDESKVQTVSNAQYEQMFPHAIDAGSALELGPVATTFGTYAGLWNSIVGQVMGFNNPAANDPTVQAVLAEFAARPDMTQAELQNRLQNTDWYKQHTQGQLEWNSLSPAERKKRTEDVAAQMQGTVFQFAGEDVDANDPRIANYAEKVASGEMGFGAWTQIIKDGSESNPESPWSRQKRTEVENQRQRPIDIENTAQKVRETMERWGLNWSPQTVQDWAKQIVEKTKSDEDLLTELRNQAQILYPWKDPQVETATAAAPWLETYRRVMERNAVIQTPEVQKALMAGQAPYDFEVELKKSDDWLGTKNGQDSIYSAISEMGARMGFV